MKETNNACKSELVTSLLFRGSEKLTVATYRGVICTEVSSATRNYNLQLKLHHDIEQYLRGIYLYIQTIFCHSGLSKIHAFLFMLFYTTLPEPCCTSRSSTTQAVLDCEHCGKAIMYTCVYIIPIVIMLGFEEILVLVQRCVYNNSFFSFSSRQVRSSK